MGNRQFKVSNLIKELKTIILKSDSEAMSLLTISDINASYAELTPRSGSSLLVDEVKEHCDMQGTRLEEIFKLGKKPGGNYILKDDLRSCLKTCLPKFSREMIEQIIKGFKEDRISYSEFLVYFDIKEAKKKTDDSIQKSQQKWVRHYSNVLNANKLDPMDILKEADKNKDGVIELKEIQDVLKQYVKVEQISFTDLQHIMDAFDANNDGRVSTQEYKDAILKYGVKIKSPEELKLEQQGFVSKVAQA